MLLVTRFWQFLTPTRAMEMTDGYYEKLFFESLYRVTYLAGLSFYDKSIGYLLYSYTVKTMIVAFVASELWYLFSQTSNLDLIIDNINVTLIHLIAMYRYRIMINHLETFRKLSQAMEISDMFDVTTPQRRKLVDFWHKKSEVYLKMLLALGTCTLATWYVYPLVDDLEYNLTVAVRVPVDYQNRVMYPIVYIIVLVAFNYTSYFVMVNDLIMQVTLMHILCQYSILADCFENILQDTQFDGNRSLNEEWKSGYLHRLGRLVNQHKFLIDNCTELKNILSVPMLFQFAASGMLICFAAYQVTATLTISIAKFLMSLQYMGYNMFELFIFCRWCDEIRIQSENIRNAVYCSGWESGAGSLHGVRARLMLVMARASKPVVMSAGGLYGLSLESYAAVIKASYTALTVLLRVRQN